MGSGGERGLNDFVLDPDFVNNGHYYVFYNHGSHEPGPGVAVHRERVDDRPVDARWSSTRTMSPPATSITEVR